MRRLLISISSACFVLLGAASVVQADVCVAIDEAHDTFSAADRSAAVLLVEKQFELEGETVTHGPCANQYTLAHIALGNTIVVTLAGPRGRREATALGLDDLAALYSQMVRSIVTGRAMEGFKVIDRTNVTAAQETTRRVPADSLWYARLGYGSVFGDRAYGGPSVGFGYRYELDSFGLDVSFLNFQGKSGGNSYSGPGYYYESSSSFSGSLLKLEGLYFVRPKANASEYFGGGLSYGGTNFGRGWHGSGLQGELTAGYEMVRASTVRVFVQGDAMFPFYTASATIYPINYPRAPVTTSHKYSPSLTVSLGVGWQKGKRR